MKYYFTYLYAICEALLHSNSKLYLVVADKKYIKPTIHFKNGSYIKVVAPNDEENNCRGKRAKIDLWEDLNTPSKEEIDEVLKGFKG